MNSALASSSLPLTDFSQADSAHASTRPQSEGLTPQARYARRIVHRLDASAAELPHDVTERLRFARERALEKARLARIAEAAARGNLPATAHLASAGASRAPSPRPLGRWWLKLAAAAPAIVLVGGLVLIQHHHAQEQIRAAADIDAALLSDDLPPAAYTDPAFDEFLKASRD